MKKKGTTVVQIDSAGAGDIVSMAGLGNPSIGHTLANVEVRCLQFTFPLSKEFMLCFADVFLYSCFFQVLAALPTFELDPPTISMTFGVNDSPLAGRDGTHVSSLLKFGIISIIVILHH